MSSLFSKPKTPDIPKVEEPVAIVTEDEGDVRRRRRKKLLAGGRSSTFLSGIQSALSKKKRLGE